MIAAAAQGKLTIDIEEYQTALNWMLEAEATSGDIFRAMSRGDSSVIEDTWYYVFRTYMKEKKPLSEARLIGFLAERTPAHNVLKVIEMMVRAKLLIHRAGPAASYEPAPRKPE